MNNLTAAAAVGRDVSKSLRINSQVRRPNIRNLPSSQIH